MLNTANDATVKYFCVASDQVLISLDSDSSDKMDGASNATTRKIITAPSLKRGKDETPPVNERVSL